MIALEIVKVAFDALRANRLRSTLTLLGVIFGVTSIMTIISALEGIMGSVEEDLATLGPSTFMVGKMMIATSHEEFMRKRKRKPIDMDAYELIRKSCDLCEKISPRTFKGGTVKYRATALKDVGIMGGTYSFIDIVDMQVAQGRFHSYEDDMYKRRVAFIGEDVRQELFEGLDPLGKTIKIDNQKYTVIGVAKAFGTSFGENRDNFVVIPLSSFYAQYGPRQRGLNLVIKAVSVEQLDDAMDEVRMILRAQRNVPYNKPDDFDMMTAESALELLNQITRVFRLGLVGISSISLVVGGIVVMNIMMVSVTERTREIGIRKSLGARRKHILLQFLYESLFLTLGGGLIGIILGFGLARFIVSWLLDMQIAPSGLAIFSGLFISTGTGLIFGIYPAMKASRMDPVKALSFE